MTLASLLALIFCDGNNAKEEDEEDPPSRTIAKPIDTSRSRSRSNAPFPVSNDPHC